MINLKKNRKLKGYKRAARLERTYLRLQTRAQLELAGISALNTPKNEKWVAARSAICRREIDETDALLAHLKGGFVVHVS